MKRVVFLDFDGVLNSEGTYERQQAGKVPGFGANSVLGIDPVHVRHLNEIVENSGAVVVVSSSWRHMYDLPVLRILLRDAGFTGKVVDVTWNLAGYENPKKPGQRLVRGHEIQDWLDRNRADHFVILDDDADMAHLLPKLVRTDWRTGLSESHIGPALAQLGVGDKVVKSS